MNSAQRVPEYRLIKHLDPDATTCGSPSKPGSSLRCFVSLCHAVSLAFLRRINVQPSYFGTIVKTRKKRKVAKVGLVIWVASRTNPVAVYLYSVHTLSKELASAEEKLVVQEKKQ
jgi:hypothetical protein